MMKKHVLKSQLVGKNKTMLIQLVDGRKIFFFHLPKTGGQSIYKAFGAKIQTHTPMTHPKRLEELRESDFAFTWVRHPLGRFVSFFYWIASLHKEPKRRRRSEHYALNLWARHADINDFYRKFDFGYWNRCSHMLRSQVWMLKQPNKKLPSKVRLYQFENFEEEFHRLLKDLEIDYPMSLPHINSSGGRRWEDELEPDVVNLLCDRHAADFKWIPFYERPS